MFFLCILPLQAEVDPSWVLNLTKKHPELLWLAAPGVQITEEGIASAEKSPSKQLFGTQFPEFDRSLLKICLQELFLDGSLDAYESFTAAQKEEGRLSQEQFVKLHKEALWLLASHPSLSAKEVELLLESALVLGDMGKSAQARTLLAPYGAGAPDHDDLYHEALPILQSHPKLSSTFTHLPKAGQDLLLSCSPFPHYGHITHLEAGPELFSSLKKAWEKQRSEEERALFRYALRFDQFIHRCDVAGALGHVVPDSSIVYEKDTDWAIQVTTNACHLILDGADEHAAYEFCLKKRGQQLGIDPSTPMGRVLVRFGCWTRCFTLEEGTLLKKSTALLSPKQTALVSSELQAKEIDLSPAATYVPAVAVNCLGNPALGTSRLERIAPTFSHTAPLLAALLQRGRNMREEGALVPSIRLCFNPLAKVAKTPEILTLTEDFCSISSNGYVSVISKN